MRRAGRYLPSQSCNHADSGGRAHRAALQWRVLPVDRNDVGLDEAAQLIGNLVPTKKDLLRAEAERLQQLNILNSRRAAGGNHGTHISRAMIYAIQTVEHVIGAQEGQERDLVEYCSFYLIPLSIKCSTPPT
jgi:hypothetical protein